MNRRTFLQIGLGTTLASPLIAAIQQGKLDAATGVLSDAVTEGRLHAAVLYVRQRAKEFVQTFGTSRSADDMFLLASISKPMSAAAVMTLYDRGEFQLDTPVKNFIPEFRSEGRDQVTMQHLLTHVAGLPDQLPENQKLRQRHAELAEFVDGAIQTPLLFEPGTQYRYSSMGILIASEVARRVTDTEFIEFIDEALFQPLQMRRSALGVGEFSLAEMIRCQVEDAAPESGAGDPAAQEWDWNSPYWRKLGAPWGGAHASAADVVRFFAEFLQPTGKALHGETAKLMIRNHNRDGLRPRGLGFAVGASAGSPGCSEGTFGHTGSTGTLAWADPATDTICVVLTTLPAAAANPHPRQRASDLVARAVA